MLAWSCESTCRKSLWSQVGANIYIQVENCVNLHVNDIYKFWECMFAMWNEFTFESTHIDKQMLR